MASSLSRVFVLALATGGLAGLGLAQKSQLKKVLPVETIVYLAAPDIDASLAEMKNMPLAKMWREAEVRDFFGDLLRWVEKRVDEGLAEARKRHAEGQFPFDPDELLELRVHGFTFAVTSLDLQMTDQGPRPRFGVLAHVNMGASTQRWRGIIDHALGMLTAQSRGQAERKESQVEGATMVSVQPVEEGFGDLGLHLAWLEDGVIIGTLGNEVRGTLAAWKGDKEVLTASKNYKDTFARLDLQGSELESFFQPRPLIAFGLKALAMAKENAPGFPQQLDPAGVARAIDALGLNSISATGSTLSYVDGRSIARSFTYSPQPERKGLFAGGDKQLNLDFLRWVPKDVASFSASTFDVAALWDGMQAALKAYDEKLAEQLLGMLGHYETQWGISLKEDFVHAIGNEFLMWSMPSAGLMSPPEMSILVKVKDEERLLKALQAFGKLTGGMVEIEEAERRGITVHRVNVNLDLSGNMGMNPFDMFSPTFAFKKGYLVGAFSTGDIKRTFNRMDREDNEPSGDVRGNVEFAPQFGKLPEKGLTSLSFTDWKANFESIYQMVTSAAAFVPVDGDIPIDLSLLPDVSTLTQHLFGSVTWGTTDGNGFHSTTHSPWGAETYMMVGAAAAGIGVGVAFMSARRR
jgi:hypothetical protein